MKTWNENNTLRESLENDAQEYYFINNFDYSDTVPETLLDKIEELSEDFGYCGDYDEGIIGGDTAIVPEETAAKLSKILSRYKKIKNITEELISLGYPVTDEDNEDEIWENIEELFAESGDAYALVPAHGELDY